MTNFNALVASPQTAAQLLAASVAGNSLSRLVLGNPDSPPDCAVTTLANLDAALKLIAASTTGLMATPAGAGFTGGTGTVFKHSVSKTGGIRKLELLFDLTGLASSTTDLDIIGVGASVAHMGRILAAEIGTPLAIRMTCLETPAGGADDIDLYSATEGTGVFDGGIAALTETALLTSGGAWTAGVVKAADVMPAANQYLYLTGGEAGTAATYTAGKFLIEVFGYDA